MTFPPWFPLWLIAVVALMLIVHWRARRAFWWVAAAVVVVTFVASAVWSFMAWERSAPVVLVIVRPLDELKEVLTISTGV